mgnify:CR=1 FL=1
MEKILAVITARGGSKGIKNNNNNGNADKNFSLFNPRTSRCLEL